MLPLALKFPRFAASNIFNSYEHINWHALKFAYMKALFVFYILPSFNCLALNEFEVLYTGNNNHNFFIFFPFSCLLPKAMLSELYRSPPNLIYHLWPLRWWTAIADMFSDWIEKVTKETAEPFLVQFCPKPIISHLRSWYWWVNIINQQ